MTDEQRYRSQGEKGEKPEKEEEKDEKSRQEKSWEEKWRRDPLNAAVWAFIIIWAGLVLLASNLNVLDSFLGLELWALFFLGAGLLLLAEAGVRMLVPAYRAPVLGNLIIALVFLAIALGQIVRWGCIWPLVLIGIGAYLLLSGVLRRRE